MTQDRFDIIYVHVWDINICFEIAMTIVIYAGGRGDMSWSLNSRYMALNCIFCAGVLRPLDLVPLTDFTYKYHPGYD